MSKVGIFSGTFDPVHAGHIAFALEAVEAAGLDKVYFLPEAVPRRKEAVTHYAHRIAMLKLALKPHQKLAVLDLPDKQFSVNKTLPRIKRILPHDELYLLVGSDMLRLLSSDEVAQEWPDSKLLLRSVKLVVGVRTGARINEAKVQLANLQDGGVVIETMRPHVSSRDIRRALMDGNEHQELLGSLKAYIKEHWLYVALSAASANNS